MGSIPIKPVVMQNKEILNKLALSQTEKKFGKNYKGLLLKVSGRLKGAQRARKLQVYHGRISTQTFNSTINYSQRQIYTKWGTLGSTVFISS